MPPLVMTTLVSQALTEICAALNAAVG